MSMSEVLRAIIVMAVTAVAFCAWGCEDKKDVLDYHECLVPGYVTTYRIKTHLGTVEPVEKSMVKPAGFVEPAGSGGGDDHDFPRAICSDSQGNVYAVGFFGWFDAPEGYTVDFALHWGSSDKKISAGSEEVFITKIGSDGEYCWTHRIGGAGRDRANAVCTDASGNVYAAGSFSQTVDFGEDWLVSDVKTASPDHYVDAYVTKIDVNGGYCWTHTIGSFDGFATPRDEVVNGVCTDTTGNVYITGLWGGRVNFAESWGGSDTRTSSRSGFFSEGFITKIDAEGGYCWTRVITLEEWGPVPTAICSCSNNSIYVTGIFQDTVDFAADWGGSDVKTALGDSNKFVTKIDESGDYCWTRTMGGPNTAGGIKTYGICSDSDCNIYVVGQFRETINFALDWSGDDTRTAVSTDIFITRINADGSYGWTHRIGGPKQPSCSEERRYGICTGKNNDLYIAGGFSFELNFAEDWGETDIKVGKGFLDETPEDGFVTKLKSQGEYCWTKRIGGSRPDSAIDICATPNGDICLAGYFYGAVNFAEEWEGFDVMVSNGGFDIYITRLNQDQ